MIRCCSLPRLVLLFACFFCVAPAAAAPPGPSLTVFAALRFEAPEIAGTATVRWRTAEALRAPTLRLALFANRFHSIDDLDDLARHELLAGSRFVSGHTDVLSAREGGRDLPLRLEDSRLGPGTILAVDLARGVEEGEAVEVTLRFATRLPNLYDSFGATDGLVVAEGGWHPMPLSLDEGSAVAAGPSPAPSVHAVLSIPAGAELAAGGRLFRDTPTAEVEAPAGDPLLFVLSRDPFAVEHPTVGLRAVTVLTAGQQEYRHRISPFQPSPAALRDSLPAIVESSVVTAPLVLVRLPLRWQPSVSTSTMVLLSDRLFEIFPVLRPLHQRELAYAIYLGEELGRLRKREEPRDLQWVAEGVAWRRAQSLYDERLRSGREVRDWIRLLDVFAVVDRFETAPRIPFIRAFFPGLASDDPQRLRPEDAWPGRPPGRFVLAKLEARLGSEAFTDLLRHYLAGREPLRRILAASQGAEAEAFLDDWLGPNVAVNYALEGVAAAPAAVTVDIARESPAARPDAIAIEVEERDARTRHAVALNGPRTTLQLPLRSPFRAVTLDPDRAAVETRLDDNRSPAEFHFLLDSADVEVSSTEFGFSSLLVARRRYDYRKDLAAAAFTTSRSSGGQLGAQWHFGPPIDANLFRHNLFLYYSIAKLDPGFHQDGEVAPPHVGGRLAGFGLRFNSYDAFWFENPSDAHHLRIFFDGYDRALGSGFGFVQGGASLSLFERLGEATVLAGHVLNGWTQATGGDRVPEQGLFSLGGFRSIRGIGAGEQLGRDIFVVRAELRRMLPLRLDWNFQELLIARRLQAKLFVDSGSVGDGGRIFDPSRFAVGVGGGVNLFYDFMGFFPTSVYVDVATRADRGGKGGVQVLFGARQPF